MNDSPQRRRWPWLVRAGIVSFVGFPVFVVLHNVFDALGAASAGIALVGSGLDILSVATFFLALLMIPLSAVLLAAAALQRLTRTRSGRARRMVIIPIALVAGVAVAMLASRLGSVSMIERDDAAGINGSFEVVQSGLPVNWYVYRAPLSDGRGELTFDVENPPDGTRALKLVAHSVESQASRAAGPGLFQTVDAETGRAYEVRFWLKSDGAEVGLLIDSETPESRDPRNPIQTRITAEGADRGAWREFTYSYTVPDHYRNIRFELHVRTPGTVWLDDVRIERRAQVLPDAG